MQKRNLCAAIAVAALLSACGGGGDDTPAATASTGDPAQAFQQLYGGGLASVATATSSAFPDVFATNYMDAGMSRAQAIDALSKEAAALSASADATAFPVGQLSNVSIANCNANGVCTLTGTLTNADADTTAVQFTTQVQLSNGTYRLLGDQQSS